MPCEWLQLADGTTVHISRGRRGGRKIVCPFCRQRGVSKLCDFPIGNGRTCDAQICDSCATNRGTQHTDVGNGIKRLNDTFDLCPLHRDEPI